MSDTPITDERAFWARTEGAFPANAKPKAEHASDMVEVQTMFGTVVDWRVVTVDVARTLERDRARVTADRDGLSDLFGQATLMEQGMLERAEKAEAEIARLTAENEALRKKSCSHQWEKVDYGLYRCVNCAAIKEGS